MMRVSARLRASAAILVIMSIVIYAAENTVINENFSANMLTVPLWIMTAVITTGASHREEIMESFSIEERSIFGQ